MFAAKNAANLVKIALAFPTYFTNDDAWFLASIMQVDKYDIEVLTGTEAEEVRVWIKKAWIVSTEVLDG